MTQRWAWAEVDLRALRRNVEAIIGDTTTHSVWAVVKADAYGHGAVECARVAVEAGAVGLCVALIDEGVALRRAGISAPILVMSEQPPEQYRQLVGNGLIATVYNAESIAALGAIAEEMNIVCAVHIKVDTGMHRVGVPTGEFMDRVRQVRSQRWLSLDGVFSHLATADDASRNDATERQVRAFASVLNHLKDEDVEVPHRHLENSAGALRHVAEVLRLESRVGIALYGIAGDARTDSFGSPVAVTLEPVLSLKARVSHVQVLEAGQAVSYGLRRPLAARTTIATVPIGYADGVRRGLWERGAVLIGGKRRPFAGVVTMDQVMVDCGDDEVRIGDEVVLLGRQGSESISANEWANVLGTIGYEVTCGISAKCHEPTYAEQALMITLYLSSADDTRGVAEAIAPLLRAGDIVSLAGEMGAGKTFFVQALVRALGISEPVTSPTFNLVHTYGGAKFPLHHADLYRLERTGELADLGLDELAAQGGVVFVEWGNVARGDLGAGLEITIEQHEAQPEARTITINWIGSRWESRWEQLRSAVAYWGRS